MGPDVTGAELIRRIRARGGDVRVIEARMQYRPLGVLDLDELAWLIMHRPEVARELQSAEVPRGRLTLGRPLGLAGPSAPAWHCRVAIKTPHEPARSADGSVFCGTCHPSTIRPRADT